MTYELPKFTDEEILASTEAHAAHWENEARYSPADVAVSLPGLREAPQNDRRMLADGYGRARRTNSGSLQKSAVRAARLNPCRNHRSNWIALHIQHEPTDPPMDDPWNRCSSPMAWRRGDGPAGSRPYRRKPRARRSPRAVHHEIVQLPL
jgi:hypothetical protein